MTKILISKQFDLEQRKIQFTQSASMTLKPNSKEFKAQDIWLL